MLISCEDIKILKIRNTFCWAYNLKLTIF